MQGLSLLYQSKSKSIIGQLNKSKEIIDNLKDIKNNNGIHVKEVLTQSICSFDNGLPKSCDTLQNYESFPVRLIKVVSQEQSSQYIELTGSSTTDDPWVPSTDFEYPEVILSEAERVEEGEELLVQLSDFKDDYLLAIEDEVKEVYPNEGLMLCMSSLDQSAWGDNVKDVMRNEETKAQWRIWPTFFKMASYSQSIVGDMESLVNWLHANVDFWCANQESQSSEFYQQVLIKYTRMPRKLSKLIRRTLSIPFSSAQVERQVLCYYCHYD